METITFGLSGNVFVFILLVVLVLSLTIFTYWRTNPPVSKSRKYLLSSLRFVGLAILLFALFEPVLTTIKSDKAEPKVLLLLDNSISMGINDGEGSRKELYKKSFENADLNELSNSLLSAVFDENVYFKKSISFDPINFKGEKTDISNAISKAEFSSDADNIKSVVLFTDGAFNSGNNPFYEAEKTGKPFFIVGIGDTAYPKDIFIHSVITNDIAYINNPLPVNVNISYNGYESAQTSISFYDNEKLVKEMPVTLNKGSNSVPVYFEYIPVESGIRKFSFSVKGFDDEITKKNNNFTKYVKVLKNKRRVAIFSGSANPDISFVKNVLKKQNGIEIEEFIQKLGNEFYNNPSDEKIAETELFIFSGFPTSSTPENIMDKISKQLSLGKPILFISGLNTDYQKLKKIEEFLPFNTASSQSREFEIYPDFYPQSLSSSILRIEGLDSDLDRWNSLPSLFRTETFVRVKPESEVLAGIKINNAPLKEPLLIVRDFQNKKSVSLLAYGIYRWKLGAYALEKSKGKTDVTDLFEVLVVNSLKWLSVSESSRRIRIQPIKDFFSMNEEIEFVAQIYDAAYNPVDNASVSVKLNTKEGIRELVFTRIGNGRYYSKIDNLPEGDYSFTGKAEKNDKMIGTDEGRFSVGGLNTEYRDIIMNYSLLSNISKISGGKFYFPEQTSELVNDIKNHPNFKPQIITSKGDISIWNNPWLMIISLVLLSLEWFLRKRSGLI